MLLAEVALLSQSRGSLYATPVMLVLVFALLPGRVRTFALLVPVAAGIGAAAPAVLRVGERLEARRRRHRGACTARPRRCSPRRSRWALVVALGRRDRAAARRPREPRPGGCTAASARSRSRRSSACWPAAWSAAGNPVTRVRHGWDTFKVQRLRRQQHQRQPAGERAGQQPLRLLPRGARRIRRPSAGRDRRGQLRSSSTSATGAANETPHYPHSVELRTLAADGPDRRAARAGGLGRGAARRLRAVACAGPTASRARSWRRRWRGFGYWAVHGSFDWFWEFAGLGRAGVRAAGLGLRAGAAREAAARPHARPRRSRARRDARTDTPPSRDAAACRRRGPPPVPASTWAIRRAVRWRASARGCPARCGAAGAIARGSVAEPAAGAERRARLDERAADRLRAPERRRAVEPAQRRTVPRGRAASRCASAICARADHEFALALRRTPGDAYATLERGAIASTRGRRRGRSRCSSAPRS